jgi:hypothetical protein
VDEDDITYPLRVIGQRCPEVADAVVPLPLFALALWLIAEQAEAIALARRCGRA